MSWMPPELAVPPEDKKHECSDCGLRKWAEEFTDDKSNFDFVCNDCYEEEEDRSDCCGAEIILHDICSECKEHI
mgnify:CR=1 FL=1